MAERIGERLGNYRLVRLLGSGGFAAVYLAEQIYLNTLAAIKVLNTHLTSETMGNFLTEACQLSLIWSSTLGVGHHLRLLLPDQGFGPLSPLPIKNGMGNVVGSTETGSEPF